MSIIISHIDEDPIRDNNSIIYKIILKPGATQNVVNYFNEVAEKQLNKQFNSFHATTGQIAVHVTGVPFPEMMKKVEEILVSVNGPDSELTAQIKEYNQKLKPQ
jgi:hypothetical protein